MRLRIVIASLLLTSTVVAGQSPAAPPTAVGDGRPIVESRIEYYPVAGRTAEEIWRSIQANGPRQAGGSFAAHTDVQLQWDYRYQPGEGGCGVTEVSVRSTVVVHLPRMASASTSDPALGRRWEAFTRALRIHEAGHQRLAEEEAHAVRLAIRGARSPTCGEIDGAVAAAVSRVNREFAERSRRYDAETGFGRTQGALWSW
jgi:predicted secreted Zn-dependent protease